MGEGTSGRISGLARLAGEGDSERGPSGIAANGTRHRTGAGRCSAHRPDQHRADRSGRRRYQSDEAGLSALSTIIEPKYAQQTH